MIEKNKFGQPIGMPIKNWQEAKRPSKNTLHGRYCILQPLDPQKHASQLFSLFNLNSHDQSWTYLGYGPFDKIDEFQNHLQELISKNDNLFYAILDPKNHQALGIAAYLRINPEHGVIEVGHLNFSKLLQKTSAATEAMYLMMLAAFEKLGYRRYEWKCNSLNQSSIKAAKRLGFTFEGIFRQSNIFRGHNRDTAWFSIIDSELVRNQIKTIKMA